MKNERATNDGAKENDFSPDPAFNVTRRQAVNSKFEALPFTAPYLAEKKEIAREESKAE